MQDWNQYDATNSLMCARCGDKIEPRENANAHTHKYPYSDTHDEFESLSYFNEMTNANIEFKISIWPHMLFKYVSEFLCVGK